MEMMERDGMDRVCDEAQEALWKCFWDEREGVFQNHFPVKEEENWIYWWHAHVLDALLDGYVRTGDSVYLERFEREYEGTYRKNGDSFLHNWYDDMEWMALALLRAFDITGKTAYREQVMLIWEDIKTAWNDHCGGGMAWKKDQRDYKNTPANGPAAILAFRLYERFGDEQDLEWGRKILSWNLEHLMDPETCFVWDGMNRMGDGKIDYEWKFTYCQGVIVGAALAYWQIARDPGYLALAGKVARRAVVELADGDGIFPYEGPDDCGLFRGIYFRYVCGLVEVSQEFEDLREVILKNARFLAQNGRNRDGLTGGCWERAQEGCVDLAQHLSAVMTLEMAALVKEKTL